MEATTTAKTGIWKKYLTLVVPILCVVILSGEVVPTEAAFHIREKEPARRTSRRDGGRSSRRQTTNSRLSADDDGSDDGDDSDRSRGRHQSSKSTPKNIWGKYMAKFDLAKSHGSGIYIDLGGTESVGSTSYRMPIGKCPVMGKVINLGNNADFLNRISAENPKDRGLAFPDTAVSVTRDSTARNPAAAEKTAITLSPVSAADLVRWGYDGNDVANCAEYAGNIIPASDQNTKYRYPFVYDAREEMCHILFTPMQYNQGNRYCDNDGSQDEGPSSLLCMEPMKSGIDAHLYYGSSRVDKKWEENCPMYPIKDAIFGRWANGSCVAIEAALEEFTRDAEECSALMFQNAAADLEIDEEAEDFDELKTLSDSLRNINPSKFAQALFSPISKTGTSAKHSKGVGMNWANYDSNTGLCRVIDETPNCLIIEAGSFAMTAVGSPLEQDAIPFPCDIVTNGYPEPRPRSHHRNTTPIFEVTTALSREALKCSKYVHEKYSESCGTYYYCSQEKPTSWAFWRNLDWKRVAKYVMSLIAIAILYMAIHWTYKRLWTTKAKPESDEYERFMSKYDYDGGIHTKGHMDQQLRSDAYVWGEAAARPSDVTPVHLSKVQ
nr:apical membrane antigen 1 [Babesia capreoli]